MLLVCLFRCYVSKAHPPFHIEAAGFATGKHRNFRNFSRRTYLGRKRSGKMTLPVPPRPPVSPRPQDPTADQLALPYILDSCDVMLYIEDEDYWEQALSRTEHFLFHRLRRLRRLAKGAAVMAATTMTAAAEQDEDVFSLSWDGERLTQRTYAETRSR